MLISIWSNMRGHFELSSDFHTSPYNFSTLLMTLHLKCSHMRVMERVKWITHPTPSPDGSGAGLVPKMGPQPRQVWGCVYNSFVFIPFVLIFYYDLAFYVKYVWKMYFKIVKVPILSMFTITISSEYYKFRLINYHSI